MTNDTVCDLCVKRMQAKMGALPIDPAVLIAIVMQLLQGCMQPTPPPPAELQARAAKAGAFTRGRIISQYRNAGLTYVQAKHACDSTLAVVAESSTEELGAMMAAAAA